MDEMKRFMDPRAPLLLALSRLYTLRSVSCIDACASLGFSLTGAIDREVGYS